jgi:hypothetical protein
MRGDFNPPETCVPEHPRGGAGMNQWQSSGRCRAMLARAWHEKIWLHEATFPASLMLHVFPNNRA